VLIKSFEEEPLPNFDQRQAMAKQLGMTPRSVQIWFQNRRQRLKPISKSASEVNLSSQSASSHQQQHFGMPGLAAAAGLFGGGLMPPQLPMQQGAAPPGVQPFLSYEVMEPFAATKALLGAGYQHSSIMNLGLRFAHHPGVVPGGASSPAALEAMQAQGPEVQAHSLDVGQTPTTQQACAIAVDGNGQPVGACPSPSAEGGAPAQKSAADGLLLLLACAGGERPPADDDSSSTTGSATTASSD